MDKRKIIQGCTILVVINISWINAKQSEYISDPMNIQMKSGAGFVGHSNEDFYSDVNQIDDVILPLSLPNGRDMPHVPEINSLVPNAPENVFNYTRDAVGSKISDKTGVYDNYISLEKPSIQFPANEGFVDIHGKTVLARYPPVLNSKRAPSGFLGLRGKKHNNAPWRSSKEYLGTLQRKTNFDGTKEMTNESADYKLPVMLELHDLIRENRKILGEINEIKQFNENLLDLISTETIALRPVKKRVPSGFLGMRGKKMVDMEREHVAEK
ncbi:uncharacterized protein LOC129769005 [Toxorhynchites rutilus septentrionalis]|uniref:uncharacterized protein LOC129769005 n=1 Tax=Toxorhynchites rutilus septentrionalis TaxID=329112 RepID=UPI002479B64E|nr:uncharacterized protein LOC129769005 [Toxorhynchites rutilus septentrionalis]XP_055626985.1 uncharacterized protein LOC129769005 [Toxorhynchites rutilus septentrionalis]